MAQNFMHYERMVQAALKGVVRESLKRVAEQGLPGAHHFYIAFRTDHPQVVLSDTLKSRYPREMTIVIQHQYWGLEVEADYFEVGLNFNKVPERLHIPFAALKGFYDPSVQFGLEFTVEGVEALDAPTVLETPEKVTEAPMGDVVSLDAFRKK